MELKDILIITLGGLGWLWAIIQFILTRKNQKRDKALEKRFDVYSSFMSKMDEINQNMRSDPKMLYGVSSDFMGKILNGDPDQINKTLLEYNDEMIEYCKRSIQPTMIINQELNKLKLVCSDQLLPKINQYKALANDFVDEFQIVMNNISSSKDINVTAKELENLGHSNRAKLMTELWLQIEKMMRAEIGYYKQN
jgi:hypothetical protein